jgi:thioredoxin reductase (NADPH)
VEAFDRDGGRRRHIATLDPRDFFAELNLLTGQRACVTGVVTQPGCILRVPLERVGPLIDAHGELGGFLVQEMFRRRQTLLALQAGVVIIGSRYAPDTQRLRDFATRNQFANSGTS